MHLQSKAATLHNVLEAASQQGVLLYKGGKTATPAEIAMVQNAYEDRNYVPDFVVKDSNGELKEIWYGTFLKYY